MPDPNPNPDPAPLTPPSATLLYKQHPLMSPGYDKTPNPKPDPDPNHNPGGTDSESQTPSTEFDPWIVFV